MITSKASEQAVRVTRNLKRAFENAVRDIRHVRLTGKPLQYRSPIVQRAGATASEFHVNAEKRALTDAAKALARLWKVSPSSSR